MGHGEPEAHPLRVGVISSASLNSVTLRAIAKEIGYTHAVIYQHFPDKWHILAELSRETIGLLVQNFDAIAAEHPAPKRSSFFTCVFEDFRCFLGIPV